MRNLRILSVLAAAATSVAVLAAGPSGASTTTSSFATITGSGTSWTGPIIAQWANDVAPQGLTVNYNPDGATEGREDYIQGGLVDFAGSDVPFRSGPDKLAGTGPEHPPWGYSYVPDAAGGTAFLYHLTVGGKKISNLRLSPKVLMEIFTGAITNWDNPQITKSYGHQLPNIAITVVLHSEGAGDTSFFTTWLSTLFPSQWNTFCQKVHPGITLPCGSTEFYPHFGTAKMEDGSANVATYVKSSAGQGSIGYDEYAWALNGGQPVLALQNPDGKYVLPTSVDDTAALSAALINENPDSVNFLQQNLAKVYTNKAADSYPLASYSYLIVPRSGTKLPPVFTKAAGQSLGAFLRFALGTGQSQLADLGYAPLPANLVKGGLEQVSHIPGA